jgi:hypothetical protein
LSILTCYSLTHWLKCKCNAVSYMATVWHTACLFWMYQRAGRLWLILTPSKHVIKPGRARCWAWP